MSKTTTEPPDKKVASAPETILQLKVDALTASPFNQRKRSGFDAKSLGELAESIKAQGVIEPLVVRSNGTAGHYELVCGERRWTAAGKAGCLTVPCRVVVADDQQVRALQITENLHREGLHPLEEAEGYAELLAQKDGKTGKPLHTVETLAPQISKSVAWIYARLKLLKMPALARQAMWGAQAKLPPSTALLIARIPDPKLADKATREILAPVLLVSQRTDEECLNPDHEPMSFRRAKWFVQETFMVRLKGAEFDPDDATLVPEERVAGLRLSGGACGSCPCRTGNQKALFTDVESTDVCTHPACFAAKKKAAFDRQAGKEADKGRTLLTPTKADRLVDYDGDLSSETRAAFVNLREKMPGKKKTWEEALGEHVPTDGSVLVAKPRGQPTALLLPRAAAADLLKKAGVAVPLPPPEDTPKPYDRAAEDAQRQARVKLANATVAVAEPLLRAALAKATPAQRLRFVALQTLDVPEAKLPGDAPALSLLLAEHAALESNWHGDLVEHNGALEETFAAACKTFGVSLKAAEAEAKKTVAASRESADPPADKKK